MLRNKIKKHEKKLFIALFVIVIAVLIFLKYTIEPTMAVGLSLRDPEDAFIQTIVDTTPEDCENLSLATQQEACKETLERLAYLKEEKYRLYGDYENLFERYWQRLSDFSTFVYGGFQVEEENYIEDHPLVPERDIDNSIYGESDDASEAENYSVYGE